MEKRNFMKKLLVCVFSLFAINTLFITPILPTCANPVDVKKRVLDTTVISKYTPQISVDSANFVKLDSTPTAQFQTKSKLEIKREIREELIAEVKRYLAKQSPNAPKELPELLVDAALENDVDLCFIMAQTQLETNFGTAGIGKATSKRSLFGVIKGNYKSYDDAVDAYMKLIINDYLVGKTEEQLMHKFVNKNGYRYGGSGYEGHIQRHYNQVVSRTPIKQIQQKYKEA